VNVEWCDMKDWKKIANALAPGIPEADLAPMLAPLDKLETAFRPLAQSLEVHDEMAVIYTKPLEDTVE
jgi:hypothetical protein